MERRARAYLRRMSYSLGLRSQLYVEPTNDCNLACEQCFHKIMKRPVGCMSLLDFKQIILINKRHGLNQVSFTGWGEPLLNPDIIEMVRFCSRQGIRTILPTNATLLTYDLSKKLIIAGLDEMRFSLDGIDGCYEAARHVSFTSVTSNVFDFCKAQKMIARHPVKPTFVLVVNNQTAPHIQEWKNWCEQFGYPVLQRETNFNGKRSTPCKVVGQSWYVWWNGDVSPCCMDYDGKLVVSNVKEHSIAEIARSGEIAELRKRHLRGEFPSPCDKCTEWNGDMKLEYRFG